MGKSKNFFGKIEDFFHKNIFIAVLILIVIILRIPSLFEPYWYGDEGIYLGLGMGVRKGLLLYRDLYDNKPPLIYLLAALVNGYQSYFKLFLTFSVVSTLYFFYRFSQKFLANEKTAKIATLILAFLTTIRALEGNIVNAEILILLPTIIGLNLIYPYLFAKEEKRVSLKKLLLAGIILSFGFLYKVPAVLDFASIILFMMFLKNSKKIITLSRQEIFLILGYLLPIATVSLFFLFKGAFYPFFQSAFLHTFGYLSSWKTGSHAFSITNLLKTDLFIKAVLLLGISVFLWMKRHLLEKKTLFLILWFVFSLFGATLSGRPYPHYLIQIILPFSLIISSFLNQKVKTSFLVFGASLLLLFVSLFYYRFWRYTTISYYQNFLQFVLQKKNKQDYFSFFNPKINNLYQLADFISRSSFSEDKIFVWADEPHLYPLSRRLPAGRFLAAYHIADLRQYDATIKAIETQKTSLIIVDQKGRDFPQLYALVKSNYSFVADFDTFSVYRRKTL